MKRICHLVHSFGIGGLEKLILDMVKDSHRHYEHSIITLTSADPFMIEQLPPEVKLYQLHKPEGHSYSVYRTLYARLRAIKPTTLHTYNLATIEYQWIAKWLGIESRIHAEHGRDSYDPDGSNNKYRMLRRWCSPAVHKFVAVSNDLGHWLHNDVGLSPLKIQVVRNGIDTDYFSRDSQFRDQKFTIGHVARMQAIKDQPLLLEAYRVACVLDSDFANNSQLVMVGDGPELDNLKQLAEQNFQGSVVFTGAKMNVKPYYQSFDLFVLSSKAEGIPVTLLEAMSMKVAPIATAVGGITEVISDRINGYLVSSGNSEQLAQAMLTLYHDPLSRARLAKHAREHVIKSYGKQQMLEQYYKLYKAG